MAFKYLERLAGGTADGIGFKALDYLLFHDRNWKPAMKKANAWYDKIVAALKNSDRLPRAHCVLEETSRDEIKTFEDRHWLADLPPVRIAGVKKESASVQLPMMLTSLLDDICYFQLSILC